MAEPAKEGTSAPSQSSGIEGIVAAISIVKGASEGASTISNALKQPAAPAGTPPTDSAPAGTTPTDSAPAGTTPTDSAPAGTPPTDSAPAGTPPADSAPAGTPPAEPDVISPILGKLSGKGKSKTEFKFESLSSVREFAKSKLGIETKDDSEIPKIFESAIGWRADSTKLPEALKKAAEYEKVFSGLDDTLADAIQAFYKGEDYTKIIESKPKLDYSKKAADFSAKQLVNNYFPGKFEDTDFEGDPGKDLEIATQAAQDKFLSEQTTYNEKRASIYKNSKAANEAKGKSVIGSVAHLQQSFPDVAESVVSEVQQAMSSGDIMSLFVNKDGTYKPEAAEMLMLARHGKQTINDVIAFTQKRVETATNEDILTRSADGSKKGRGAQAQATNENVKAFMNTVIGTPKKKPTY